jgi:hypothetical protein
MHGLTIGYDNDLTMQVDMMMQLDDARPGNRLIAVLPVHSCIVFNRCHQSCRLAAARAFMH